MRHARPDYNRFQDPEGKIPADEPVFLLRAQDKHAAAAVFAYASMLDRDPEAAPEMAALCRWWAHEMAVWQPKKSPDLLPPQG